MLPTSICKKVKFKFVNSLLLARATSSFYEFFFHYRVVAYYNLVLFASKHFRPNLVMAYIPQLNPIILSKKNICRVCVCFFKKIQPRSGAREKSFAQLVCIFMQFGPKIMHFIGYQNVLATIRGDGVATFEILLAIGS